MKISIVGSGYVGTTVGACLADLGHNVVCIDLDKNVVKAINAGISPVHEPQLSGLIARNVPDHLSATTDYDDIKRTSVTFLSLPTPINDEGSIDTSILKESTESLGSTVAEMDSYHVTVVKSTVTPGTTERLLRPLIETASGKTVGDEIGLAVNPEFLREGTAVTDFLTPDKMVFGGTTKRAITMLEQVYEPLLKENHIPVIETGIREAEMIKIANNAFLATKISLINEIGNICKEFEIDSYEVAKAIGLDHRISEQFLRSGIGWGGSCFPKDIAALIAAARDAGYDPELLEAAVSVNVRQPDRMVELLDSHLDIADKRIAVLGLAFKPDTDDIRNSQAISVIEKLRSRNANIVAYDPIALENMRAIFPDIEYVNAASKALEDSHAALILTDWDEFSALNKEFDLMITPIVIDGCHVIDHRDSIIYEELT